MLSQTSCFDFSSSNFHLQGHILSTSGVALKRKTKYLKHSLPAPHPNAYLLESSQWLNMESLQPSKFKFWKTAMGQVYKAKCKTSVKPLSLITGFTDWLFFNWTSNIINIPREVVEMGLHTENCNSSCQGKAWDFQANENKEVPLIILQSHRFIRRGKPKALHTACTSYSPAGWYIIYHMTSDKKISKTSAWALLIVFPCALLIIWWETGLYILDQVSLMTSITQTPNQENTIGYQKQMEMRLEKEERWTFPTQSDIQGQWWSNCSTHRLQDEQCFALRGLTI